MKFYKSTKCPFMEYCCHVWPGVPSCYLELLDKLQNGYAGVSVFGPLAHCENVASLSLFYGYYFGRCASELAQLVPLPSSQGRSICYSDRLHDFSVTISRCYKDVYVNKFFPPRARLCNSISQLCCREQTIWECDTLRESHLAINQLEAQSCVNSQQRKFFFKVENVFISTNLVKLIIFNFSFR